MTLRFKIIDSNRNEFLGWFGEDLIKVRILDNGAGLLESFLEFLESNLGIKKDTTEIISFKQNFLEMKFPDIAWELFLTVVK